MPERQPMLFPEGRGTSGILIDTEIQGAVDTGNLISRDTFQQSSLEASSYDVRVGYKGILGGEGIEIDLRRDTMELAPGAYGGVISSEKFNLPENICARIGSKRALSYDGVILLTGTTVDPGYQGHLLFGLYNASQRRVIIRSGRKLCNIVFERLSKAPDKLVSSDPNLLAGSFPDAFVDRIANMEVLPWMQISDRVKQIEQITKDILDLKARYDDVLQPIRDLTTNVKSLTQDVTALTGQTKALAEDVDNVGKIVAENGRQISQLTSNLAVLTGSVQVVQERTRGLEDADRSRLEDISNLKTTFGRFQILVSLFWAVVLLALGALLPTFFEKVFQ